MHLKLPGTTRTLLVPADKSEMTNTDTCVINKIRIRVDVFGDRKREEIEINQHIYSTVPLPSKTN